WVAPGKSLGQAQVFQAARRHPRARRQGRVRRIQGLRRVRRHRVGRLQGTAEGQLGLRLSALVHLGKGEQIDGAYRWISSCEEALGRIRRFPQGSTEVYPKVRRFPYAVLCGVDPPQIACSWAANPILSRDPTRRGFGRYGPSFFFSSSVTHFAISSCAFGKTSRSSRFPGILQIFSLLTLQLIYTCVYDRGQ